MDKRTLQRTLREAEADLRRLESKTEVLRRYIAQTREVMAALDVPDAPPATITALDRGPRVGPKPATRFLYHAIADVLRAHGRPMSADDIVPVLVRSGWPLTEKARDVVRVSMRRRPEIFAHIGRTLWGLAEWPQEMKQGVA